MKIENRHDIHKNMETGVVHYNINKTEMERVRRIRKNKRDEKENLKSEMNEIKSMLKTLMEKL